MKLANLQILQSLLGHNIYCDHVMNRIQLRIAMESIEGCLDYYVNTVV